MANVDWLERSTSVVLMQAAGAFHSGKNKAMGGGLWVASVLWPNHPQGVANDV